MSTTVEPTVQWSQKELLNEPELLLFNYGTEGLAELN